MPEPKHAQRTHLRASGLATATAVAQQSTRPQPTHPYEAQTPYVVHTVHLVHDRTHTRRWHVVIGVQLTNKPPTAANHQPLCMSEQLSASLQPNSHPKATALGSSLQPTGVSPNLRLCTAAVAPHSPHVRRTLSKSDATTAETEVKPNTAPLLGAMTAHQAKHDAVSKQAKPSCSVTQQ